MFPYYLYICTRLKNKYADEKQEQQTRFHQDDYLKQRDRQSGRTFGRTGKEGFQLTQATLSRDLKQLKVAKAASMNGNYVYVLPNNTMYKRMTDPQSASEMLRHTGFLSIEFSGNIAVIKTRPGYASSLAYDIDNNHFHEIIGTIAGDDTIMLVMREGCTRTELKQALAHVIANINL